MESVVTRETDQPRPGAQSTSTPRLGSRRRYEQYVAETSHAVASAWRYRIEAAHPDFTPLPLTLLEMIEHEQRDLAERNVRRAMRERFWASLGLLSLALTFGLILHDALWPAAMRMRAFDDWLSVGVVGGGDGLTLVGVGLLLRRLFAPKPPESDRLRMRQKWDEAGRRGLSVTA